MVVKRLTRKSTYVNALESTTLFSLSDHYILSRERRVIVDQVRTNCYGGPMVVSSARCDRAVDYEGS